MDDIPRYILEAIVSGIIQNVVKPRVCVKSHRIRIRMGT